MTRVARGLSAFDAALPRKRMAAGVLLFDAVDWVPPRPDRSEGLITIFDGGLLEPDEISRIRVPPEELASYELVDMRRAVELLSPLLGRRVAACLAARAENRSVYLENGAPT